MADEPTPRMFSETEHLAILADRVTAETATITQDRDAIKSDRDDLATKLDVETAAKTAAETRATEAETALQAFKDEVQAEREAASRKDERLGKVKEAAPHLGEEFLDEAREEAKARIVRIVAMDDDAFTAYVTDLGATKPEGYVAPVTPPRQTAMVGAGATQPTGGEATRSVLLGRYGAVPVQNGA